MVIWKINRVWVAVCVSQDCAHRSPPLPERSAFRVVAQNPILVGRELVEAVAANIYERCPSVIH